MPRRTDEPGTNSSFNKNDLRWRWTENTEGRDDLRLENRNMMFWRWSLKEYIEACTSSICFKEAKSVGISHQTNLIKESNQIVKSIFCVAYKFQLLAYDIRAYLITVFKNCFIFSKTRRIRKIIITYLVPNFF